MDKETEVFSSIIDFELETSEKRLKDMDLLSKLKLLPHNLKEKCPLIYNIVEVLLIGRSDGTEGRVKSAVHALFILLSLRSQKLQNSFKLMFTALCVSYGAGDKFTTLLNHTDLTVSWRKFVGYLDKRLSVNKLGDLSKVKDCLPIVLLTDSINMYRGKKKHLRLLKHLGPTMWNFTGQAVIIPNISKCSVFFNDPEKTLKPQKDILSLEGNDIFVDKEPAKEALWNKAVDKYLLQLLDDALNNSPSTGEKPLNEMTEEDVTERVRLL